MNTEILTRDRFAVAQAMSRLLADSYLVYLKTHGYHWNVKGPMFHSLHNLFMEQYTELWLALDEIAERIRALGMDAPCTHAKFSALSQIQDMACLPSAATMIADLLQGQIQIVQSAREVVLKAQKAQDDATADLATQRIGVHEKNAWMLRSFLHR